MKKLIFPLVLILSTAALPVIAAHDCSQANKLAASASSDATWLAKAKAEYPLKTCVVDGGELGGSMGEAIDYIYKQDGQPDRLVRFSCAGCIKDFNKDPAKYLKKIDEAAALAKKS